MAGEGHYYYCVRLKGGRVLKDEKIRYGERIGKKQCSTKKHVRDDEMGADKQQGLNI